jgi:biotin operon repressor
MTPLFPGLKHFEVKEKIRGYIRSKIESEPAEKKTADLEETILAKLKKGATLEQLSVATALPELAVKGYIQELENKGLEIETNGIDYKIKTQVIENQEPRVKDAGWSGDQIIRFGLMGDTQINSKYTQLTHLHKYYDICESEGISDVYHTGDIDEGEQMRMGHQYECYNQGADDHVNEIVRVYPERKGITTHFITGNHDASIIKRCGYNIGVALANKRKDLDYLGADCAVVKLTPNCTLQLQHNWDGTAYALSYKPQKMIEAMEADSKPNILAIGHYHKAEYLFYRNVHAFQTGCFQGQTPFTRGKGISIHVGGWIITIQVNDKGHIQRIVPEFIPFYSSIPDDYKNWQ